MDAEWHATLLLYQNGLGCFHWEYCSREERVFGTNLFLVFGFLIGVLYAFWKTSVYGNNSHFFSWSLTIFVSKILRILGKWNPWCFVQAWISTQMSTAAMVRVETVCRPWAFIRAVMKMQTWWVHCTHPVLFIAKFQYCSWFWVLLTMSMWAALWQTDGFIPVYVRMLIHAWAHFDTGVALLGLVALGILYALIVLN